MSRETAECPHCGKAMLAGGLGGLCPACLLQQGAAGDTVAVGGFLAPQPEELADRFPQLELLDLVGAGGMGAVYRARQRGLDRIVALKILPPAVGERPGFARRFTREAKALARLSHPGIVTIHDTGQVDGLYYLVMEYVDGVNLRRLIEAGSFSAREALAIVPQICDALQYAHDAGIVHRDIKPENILIDRLGRVKVADFGLAKLVGSDDAIAGGPAADGHLFSQAGQVMGTPAYMAPEQVEHPGAVDRRADIYSLGVVFYQMLTGELPGASWEPPSRRAGTDVRLDEVVLRALEQRPGQRFQQASQVKELVKTIAALPPNEAQEDNRDMDIICYCPNCSQKLSVEPSMAGETAACPACAEPMVIPGPPVVAPVPQAPAQRVPAPGPAARPGRAAPVPARPPTRAKGLAIWGFVLSLVGVVPVIGLATGVFGLLLGVIALVQRTTSRGLAIAGTAIGGLAVLMIPVHLAAAGSAASAARFTAGTATCAGHLVEIGEGISRYRERNGGLFPPDLATLERDGLVDPGALRCPLHGGGDGYDSYAYSRPAGREARGLVAWDREPHQMLGGVTVGRNVLGADLAVRFLSEDQFRQSPRAADAGGVEVPWRGPDAGPRPAPGGSPSPPVPSPSPPVRPPEPEPMTVARALVALGSTAAGERREAFRFLEAGEVDEGQRGEVIAALRPLLNDAEYGDQAFGAFAQWAGPDEIPDLVEIVRVTPNSARGKRAMVLLSRTGDERAVAPLVACLEDFHLVRDAKAALVALGDVAKPEVLSCYHHPSQHVRDAARELLRGYQASEDEILEESMRALGSDRPEVIRSALRFFSETSVPQERRAEVARLVRPLIIDGDGAVRDAARIALKPLATTADADFLLEQMANPDERTRQFATELLVEFKDARVAVPLAALLADSRQTHRAGDQLARLGSVAEPAVVPFLRHEDWGTRKRAAEVLGVIGTSLSLRALQITAEDSNFFVKVASENAISAIRGRGVGGQR